MKSLSVVCTIDTIRPHPNADRVEIIRVYNPLPADPRWPAYAAEDRELVVGKHYRAGDLGVWLKPGAKIPGWLAHDLWLVGKERASDWFEVREIPIRGVASPGLWCGMWYRNDKSEESHRHVEEMVASGAAVVDGWVKWKHWDDGWAPGDAVDIELGLIPV